MAKTLGGDKECSCEAVVDRWGEIGDGHWDIVFSVSVDDCEYSTGSFDFTIVARDDDGEVKNLDKSEAWVENDTSEFEVTHNTQLASDQVIDDVKDIRNKKCTCRE